MISTLSKTWGRRWTQMDNLGSYHEPLGRTKCWSPCPLGLRKQQAPGRSWAVRRWWCDGEVGWGEISRNQRAGGRMKLLFLLHVDRPNLLFHLPIAHWRGTPSQPAFGFHPISWEINPTQGEQRGIKGQLEALDVKESHLLTAMLRIQVELPGDLSTKALHFFYCHFVYEKSPYRFQCDKAN